MTPPRLALSSCLLLTIAFALPLAAQQPADAVEARVNTMLSQLTTRQKLELVGGNGMYTFAIPEIGLQAIKMSDGPSGVRTWGPSTAYPVGIALAATWDPAIAQSEGASLAQDAKMRNVRVLLAPGVNISRTPMNGRNFEYFGEDPWLTSRLAVGYIEGVQSGGVSATVKHFLANNSEFDRHNTDAVIDERTLREIYLPAFEAAVREAHVSAVMDSYNVVNGLHMTQNGAFNLGVLKHDWGFDGLLMSDWNATYDGVAAVNGGLDIEMPKAKFMTSETLGAALKSGTLTQATLDEHVRRILRLAVRYGAVGPVDPVVAAAKPTPDLTPAQQDRPEARQLAYRVAAESVVLLKNDGHLLPMDVQKARKIAIIGPNAYPGSVGGGGSSFTTAVSIASLRDSLQSAAPHAQILYTPGLLTENQVCAQTKFVDGLDQKKFVDAGFSGNAENSHVDVLNNWKLNYRAGGQSPVTAAYRWTGRYTAVTAGNYLFLVTAHADDSYHLFVDGKDVRSISSQEHASPKTVSIFLHAGQTISVQLDYVQHGKELNAGLGIIRAEDMLLPDAAKLAAEADIAIVNIGMNEYYEGEGHDRPWELLSGQDELVEAVLSANPHTAVVLNGGGSMNIAHWTDRVPALLHAWYGGEEGGHALADILTGVINPSGKLPITFERKLEDNGSAASYYPKDGTVEVPYSEGIFVGYRHFDQDKLQPLFPFGFGLSYTSFAFTNLHVIDDGSGNVRVSFDVKNTGPRAGDEIAQLYVGEIAPPLPRPVKELKGFQRVHLAAGATQHIEMALNARAFSYWDVATHGWKRDTAKFTIAVGDSSAALPLSQTVAPAQ